MGYDITGTLTEVCTCDAFCPCFAGRDPDGGSCAFSWLFDLERGTIGDVDVAGTRMGFIGSFTGNPTDGTIRLAVLVDDQASAAQHDALVEAFTGGLGGPLEELAGLVAEVVTVQSARIEGEVVEGTGSYRIGGLVAAEVEGFRTPDGTPTTMRDMPLSPVLGSPAWPGAPTSHRVDAPELGFEFRGNSSIQTRFEYVAA